MGVVKMATGNLESDHPDNPPSNRECPVTGQKLEQAAKCPVTGEKIDEKEELDPRNMVKVYNNYYYNVN